jgi:ribonuclease Z
MEVILLGTSGGGLLVPDRHLMSQVVIVDGEPLLFDCGEGATRQLVKADISPQQVKHLFFTHYHLDHITDYAYFVFTTWLEGRDQNLQVYGPPEIKRITDLLFGENGAYRQDQTARYEIKGSQDTMRERTGRGLSKIEVDVTEFERGGLVGATEQWRVTAAPTQHVQPYMDTYAYRIDARGGSVVIAGDTAPTQSVIDLARDADILVHECSAPKDVIDRYGYEQLHTWPEAAAKLASEANVRKLVLVHFFRQTDHPDTLAAMAAVIRDNFAGAVHMGHDLMRIEV